VTSPARDRNWDHGLGARAVALAAAVEAMSTGHVRVLAAELRAVLEDAMGPSAEVIPMRGREPKR
jgi:hypothetical protein